MYTDLEITKRSAFEEAVHEAISKSLGFRAWPEDLKREVANHTEKADRKSLVFQQTIGLVITILTCVIDLWSIPHEAVKGAILRGVFVIPVAAAVILFSNRFTLRQLNGATGYTMTAFAVILVHLGSCGDPETAARYAVGSSLLLGMGLLALPFRSSEAAIFASIYTAATMVAGIWPYPIPFDELVKH